MSERSENVLSWNVPNVITIWLMISLLWVSMGIASHLLFRKHKASVPAVAADAAGNAVPVA